MNTKTFEVESSLDAPTVEEKEGKASATHHLGEVEPAPAHHSLVAPDGGQATVTLKTWIAIWILSASFGISFWPVPTTGAMGQALATKFGDVQSAPWIVPAYTVSIAISQMLCGGNSDLFGRRWFLIGGNIICLIGYIVAATANTTKQLVAAMVLLGFGGGLCVFEAEVAMWAIPELLPNKWRHIGVVIADTCVFFAVVVGPIVGRIVIDDGGNTWRWVYIAGAIATCGSGLGLYWCYFPPAHPRGVPFWEAIHGMDWVGMFLFTAGFAITMSGIINTTYIDASNVRVIATLCVGFGVMILFGLWEQFGTITYPLCPTHVFTRNHGRTFTAPFVVGIVLGMVYYAINIIYPTCINVFYVGADTPRSEQLALTLPGNLGLTFGGVLLVIFGERLRHFRLQLNVTLAGTVLFGGLIAVVTPDNKGTIIAFTFLEQMFYGWSVYLCYTYVQQGVDQIELGIAGGLCGVMRFVGGSLAQAIYTTVLVNKQGSEARKLIPQAALAAGLPPSSLDAFMAAFPTNTTQLGQITGVDTAVLAAAGEAFQLSYAHALKILALVSVAFGGLAIAVCVTVENIDPKMNDQIEVFLENDKLADKNVYH
ncbi:hypothetical protein AYO21_02046 [Fonsecaea monophora]|uniref:Major facilitator superfamily (MFS) profile domain-containing protein n=1 Tax=Fonsecaea monophora TaxID=254056 RepID=A0A177FKZ4_9EURO|nr:hypothetical protein AYO21_02046 [Fonsecaea monophora]OAG43819.1 hypothetical protein AYO21_02046 [Fonsecaea monophora]